MIKLSDCTDLPTSSGIYRFMEGDVPIYIGKSVNIKARVQSHIHASVLSKKEALIVNNATTLDYQTTLSDFDAIILEANLIKKFLPKYNIALKDDKHFLYIKITMSEEFPKVFPVRKEYNKKDLYFGPFNSSKTTIRLLYYLRRIVPFCTQKKMGKAPCFYSKIGLCSPCPTWITKQDEDVRNEYKSQYLSQIKILKKVLQGDGHELLTELQARLNDDVLKQDYEDAIKARDTMLSIKSIFNSNSFSNFEVYEYDKSTDISLELDTFIQKYFSVTIDKNNYRIECYDMSTLFGDDSTGSMVVFEDGNLNLSQYRRFKIKGDFGSDMERMGEVLRRRFKKTEWRAPDLIVVDGGRPQLRTVHAVLQDLGLNIPLIGIAKKPDRIILAKSEARDVLKRGSHLFKCIQLLRDESHRFAKKYHLLLRHKKIVL